VKQSAKAFTARFIEPMLLLRTDSLPSGEQWLYELKVLPKLPEPVRYSAPLDADLPVLIQSVKAHGFEGLVAKRRNSPYEPGLRVLRRRPPDLRRTYSQRFQSRRAGTAVQEVQRARDR
jgi:hypothetical protein